MIKVGRGAFAPPFMVMDVISAANARAASLPPGVPRVLRMEVGQPGTGAPHGARLAAAKALGGADPMGYTEALGRPSLRARLRQHYADWYGVVVPEHRIAVTLGASGAFPLAFLAAFNPGDRVALASPFYPPYVNILMALGLEPVIVETGPENRYQPTPALLDQIDPPPDGLIVASPCNPAGTVLDADELHALARWCDARGVRLVSDEIYHGLRYARPIPAAAGSGGAVDGVSTASVHRAPTMATAAQFSPSAIVIGSFSKYFGMTGWRVGWMALPDDLRRPVEGLAQNLFISAPHISQIAAEAALDCDEELQANVARYARSRELLMNGLPGAGFPALSSAEGAFYLWADVSHRTNDSEEFCARMLRETGVAAAPGIDFDRTRGSHYVRFSYCGPEADMAQAVERLTSWR